MAEISVIVPVYNAEKYIENCIASLLNQTYADFEVILVDDGSSDNSSQICDSYAEKDGRIHVIHQENQGPSKARNKGIEYAFQHSESSYLTFVDSDDSLHPQFLEYMAKAAETNSADIVMCHHRYIQKREVVTETEYYSESICRKLSAEDLMVEESTAFNYIWGKLYRKVCFENVQFPEKVSFGEDNLIIYKIIFDATGIVLLEQKLYNYCFTNTGITKSPWKPDSLAVFQGIEEQLNYYQAHDFEKAYRKETELYIQQCAYQIHRIRENKADFSRNKEYLKQIHTKMVELLKDNPEYSLKQNYYWFEALHPNLARSTRKIKNVLALLKEKGVTGVIDRLKQRL